MKKAPAVIAVILTALVLLGTISFYILKNTGGGTIHIRTLIPTMSVALDQTVSQEHSATGLTMVHLVNINTADLDELMTLPGIGEVLAGRIIDYRTEHGPFSSPAGLLNVSGIGGKKLEAILDLITTGGNT